MEINLNFTAKNVAQKFFSIDSYGDYLIAITMDIPYEFSEYLYLFQNYLFIGANDDRRIGIGKIEAEEKN